MKSSYKKILVLFILMVVCVFSVIAQDLIILRDGNIIEAKVLEISSSEIRYRRSDHLDGPIIVVLTLNVLSIRYENGTVETFEAVSTQTTVVQADRHSSPGMDPNRLTFGINIDPSGFALYGPSVTADFTKGKLNTQITLRFPSIGLLYDYEGFGLGFGLALNYFSYSRIGGFYLGGMFEYSTSSGMIYGMVGRNGDKSWHECEEHNIAVAMSIGYKFILTSGIYFRTGGYLGALIDVNHYTNGLDFLIRPELTIGYIF